MQNYKIFIKNAAFYFVTKTNKSDNTASKVIDQSELVLDILSLYQMAEKHNEIIVVCSKPKEIFNVVSELFVPIEAAGGIVLNANQEMLWIKRLGKWDLPKGKIEIGESREAAAIREVEEETGISDLDLKKLLHTSYHTYNIYGDENIKRTDWYLMNTDSMSEGIPQQEEDITEVIWVKLEENSIQLANTYPSILDVIKAYR